LDIPFSYIDINFLKNYEVWMRKRNLKGTTISLFFRTLRSAYNKAIQDKIVKKTSYPFKEFKISKFDIKTDKRAISKDIILKIMNLDLSTKSWYMNFSRDMFIFSYLCGGINMTDVGNLKFFNIIGDRLVYIRDKTGKKINIPLSDKTLTIIEKYKNKSFNDCLFPFLNDDIHKSIKQKRDRKIRVLDLQLNATADEDVVLSGGEITENYSQASFERPISLSLSTQVKVFLAGIESTDKKGFTPFGDLEIYESVDNMISALQEAFSQASNNSIEGKGGLFESMDNRMTKSRSKKTGRSPFDFYSKMKEKIKNAPVHLQKQIQTYLYNSPVDMYYIQYTGKNGSYDVRVYNADSKDSEFTIGTDFMA
jgi:hypothetical protein